MSPRPKKRRQTRARNSACVSPVGSVLGLGNAAMRGVSIIRIGCIRRCHRPPKHIRHPQKMERATCIFMPICASRSLLIAVSSLIGLLWAQVWLNDLETKKKVDFTEMPHPVPGSGASVYLQTFSQAFSSQFAPTVYLTLNNFGGVVTSSTVCYSTSSRWPLFLAHVTWKLNDTVQETGWFLARAQNVLLCEAPPGMEGGLTAFASSCPSGMLLSKTSKMWCLPNIQSEPFASSPSLGTHTLTVKTFGSYHIRETRALFYGNIGNRGSMRPPQQVPLVPGPTGDALQVLTYATYGDYIPTVVATTPTYTLNAKSYTRLAVRLDPDILRSLTDVSLCFLKPPLSPVHVLLRDTTSVSRVLAQASVQATRGTLEKYCLLQLGHEPWVLSSPQKCPAGIPAAEGHPRQLHCTGGVFATENLFLPVDSTAPHLYEVETRGNSVPEVLFFLTLVRLAT